MNKVSGIGAIEKRLSDLERSVNFSPMIMGIAAVGGDDGGGGVGAHALLSATHTDTAAQTVSRGSLIYGNSTPAWDELTLGAADRFLGSDGTDAAWTAPGALTKTDDTNVTLTLGGSPTTALLRAASLTLGWTGTLAAARLNSNVVQSVVNDTNVTGSISAQALTLGWTGQLGLTRGGTGINASSVTDLFNQLDPLTTRGDLLTRDATNSIRLAVGASGRYLRSDGTDPSWVAATANDDFTQYTKLAGRTGTTNDTTISSDGDGTVYGSAASGGSYNVQSTSHGTRGTVNLVDESRWNTSLSTIGGITAYGARFNNTLSLTNISSQLYVLDVSGTWTHSTGFLNQHRLFNVAPTLTNSAGQVIPGLIALGVQPTITAGVAASFHSGIAVFVEPTFNTTGSGSWVSGTRSYRTVNSKFIQSAGTWGTRQGLYHEAATGSGTIDEDVALDVAALAAGSGIAVRSAITAPTSGAIGTIAAAPTAGGTGYTVGDVLTITTGGSSGTVTVTAVSAGVVTAVWLSARGSGYTTGTGKATSGGTGSGCTINITALQTKYFLRDTGGAPSTMVGKFTTYNNTTTAGFGLTTIVAVGRSTAQTAAVASVATFTPSADGTFRVSANVLPTTSTTHTFTVTVAYTDEGNTARTLTLNFFTVAGGTTVTSSIANAAGAVPYHGIPVHIRAKSGAAITVATTGTFTTVTYNVEAVIEQLA